MCRVLLMFLIFVLTLADGTLWMVSYTISCDGAGHSVCMVLGMNSLSPIKHWDRGLESYYRHGCLRVYSVFVLSCV
jgi:hypothetical protein